MEELLSVLKAAAEPTRLRLLALLTHGELSVSELTQILAQSQPRISRHLKLLTDAGLIMRCREGAWAFYRLAEQGPHEALARLLVDEIRGDEPVVARDRERLKAVRAARAEAAAAYFRANAARWDEIRTLYLTESEVEAAMLDLIGPGPLDSMIDLGTGTGRVLEIFAPVARRAIGFDVNHEMLTVARTNLAGAALSHCQVRHGDLFGLPAGTGPADLVTLHQVLHYLDDPAGAVVEAARLVAPGGRLLIVDFLSHDFDFLRSQHAHRRLGFSPQEVAGWCRQAGLRAGPPQTLPPEGPGLTVALWCAQAARVVRPAQLVAE